jgi:cation diffusion facilitator CzcD-associated flavoprotein CzcO
MEGAKVTDTRSNARTSGLGFDPDALHKRYLEERDKRLRPDGIKQYVRMEGRFGSYAEDPFADEGFTRPPKTDSVEVAVIGGGFSGLITAGRLRQAGVADIRVFEKGADFGGIWYWNRYPGVRCDVESYIYMPFLEETGYVPSEKYAGGAEILAHCQRIGRHFDLYANACLQTQVTSLDWEEDSARWVIRTDRDDEVRARFVCLVGGGFHRPKLPGVPGIEDFQGTAFHTSRWDYSYTGGNSDGNLTGLRDKRVGIIGTGATAIQCIPHLGEAAQQLIIFQRTPSSVDIRNNKLTDPEWAASLEPGWQKRRMTNFTAIVGGVPQDEDLVADRWTDVWGRLWHFRGLDPTSELGELLQLADYEKMEEIRARCDEIVTDRFTAEALKPWYNWSCKRPLYSDDFLQTFNRPSVTLVDTQGRGVDRITATGVVVGETLYELDCLVFATGFTTGLPPHEAGEYRVTGRGDADLAKYWSESGKTVHGVMAHGFPNLFIQGHGNGTASSVNVPYSLTARATHSAGIIKRCLDLGVRTMEPRPEAQDAWTEVVAAHAVDRSKFLLECTPGYFNREGQVDAASLARVWGGSPLEWVDTVEEWRSSPRMLEDLDLTYESESAQAGQ